MQFILMTITTNWQRCQF